RSERRRRSQRLRVRIPVEVRGQSLDKQPIVEKADALVVNAHGALVLLAMNVAKDQMLILANPKTSEEVLCRVSNLGPSFMGKTEVGVEFIKPAPNFWGAPSPSK